MNRGPGETITARRARPIVQAVAAAVVASLVGVTSAADDAPGPRPLTSRSAVDPPVALPAASTRGDARWQPALDYDADGCYPTPAIDADGVTADGLPLEGGSGSACRERSDLANTNAYVRTACQSGWRARMYAYYFEKDLGDSVDDEPSGHRHDFEQVVVWVRGGEGRFVAVSQHTEYEIRPADTVPWQGSHPKVVYHQDGESTHAFRFARTEDDPPENHERAWQYPTLVSWHLVAPALRSVLARHDFGQATIALPDDEYDAALALARPTGVPFDT